MKRSTLYFMLACLLTATVVCFIFSNSLQGPEESSQKSGMVMAFLRAILDPRHTVPEENFHHYVRKCAHFAEFALLGVSLWLLMASLKRRFALFCPGFMLLAALLTAVTDEFIQNFTGRGSSVTDVLIDFSGVALAFGVLSAFFAIRKYKEQKYAAKKCRIE